MKLAAGGHTIGLLTLTRGDAGLWLGKAFGSWSPSELAAERATEWAAAVGCVGFGWSRLLRYPDGGLKDAPADVITADIVQAIREVRPDVVLKPTRGDLGITFKTVDEAALDAAALALAGAEHAQPALVIGRDNQRANLGRADVEGGAAAVPVPGS